MGKMNGKSEEYVAKKVKELLHSLFIKEDVDHSFMSKISFYDEEVIVGASQQMEGMKGKGDKMKGELQRQVDKSKNTVEVEKKTVHDKDRKGMFTGTQVGSTIFSDGRRDKERPLGQPMKLEQFIGGKGFTNAKNNANIQYLVQWKGLLYEDNTWRLEYDVIKQGFGCSTVLKGT